MRAPLVTVIVPNFNHSKYLPIRLESILNQTFGDFDVVILDDCSTDNSREVIESYRGNPKITAIIYNETNSGSPFIQWNKGVKMAQGSLIWIAESDDYCKLNFLEETVAKMNANPSVGLVYTQSLEVDEITKEESLSFQYSPRFKNSFVSSYFANGRNEISEKLVHENTIPNASGVLIRKKLFENVGGADESMRLCGDWFLWVKILMSSDIYFIEAPLNIFRLTDISVRMRFSKVQTFHERTKILNWMRYHGIKQIGSKERILLINLFNSFKIPALATPLHMVLTDRSVPNRYLKIFPALFFSAVDRIEGWMKRNKNGMAAL